MAWGAKSSKVECSGLIQHETPKAWLVDFGTKNPVWVPKSMATHDEHEQTFTMPEWLANEKGIL